jgi:hypothetical protein
MSCESVQRQKRQDRPTDQLNLHTPLLFGRKPQLINISCYITGSSREFERESSREFEREFERVSECQPQLCDRILSAPSAPAVVSFTSHLSSRLLGLHPSHDRR